jgi:hypothetical protein
MDDLTCAKLRSIFDAALEMLPPIQQGIVAGLYLGDVRVTRKALMARYGIREQEFKEQHVAALSKIRSVLKTYRIETVAHVI